MNTRVRGETTGTKTPWGFGDLSQGVQAKKDCDCEISMAATVKNRQAFQTLMESKPTRDCGYCDSGTALKLRSKPTSNGVVQYVWQCQKCGDTISGPLKHDLVKSAFTETPPPFDHAIREEWNEARRRVYEAHQTAKDEAFEREREEHARWYHEYLTTPRWHRLRAMVLTRCRGRCEGCGQREAEEVHHLTYAHVGSEFLFELVGLCGVCHARVHEVHQWAKINPYPVQS